MADNITPIRRRQSPGKQTRLNININDQTAHALRRYSAENGVTITEAVRRFAGVADHILTAIADGNDVLFRKDGESERVVFTF